MRVIIDLRNQACTDRIQNDIFGELSHSVLMTQSVVVIPSLPDRLGAIPLPIDGMRATTFQQLQASSQGCIAKRKQSVQMVWHQHPSQILDDTILLQTPQFVDHDLRCQSIEKKWLPTMTDGRYRVGAAAFRSSADREVWAGHAPCLPGRDLCGIGEMLISMSGKSDSCLHPLVERPSGR